MVAHDPTQQARTFFKSDGWPTKQATLLQQLPTNASGFNLSGALFLPSHPRSLNVCFNLTSAWSKLVRKEALQGRSSRAQDTKP